MEQSEYLHEPVIYCPACGKQYQGYMARIRQTEDNQRWSDGYCTFDPALERLLISRCDACFHFFRVDQPGSARIPLANPDDPRRAVVKEWSAPPEIRKLTCEELAEALAIREYSSPREEISLRMRLWWRINDFFRKNRYAELQQDYQSIFLENLESLIYHTPPDSCDNVLLLAEMHRELGQFAQAEHWLFQVPQGKADQRSLIMKQKILDHDRIVFLVGED